MTTPNRSGTTEAPSGGSERGLSPGGAGPAIRFGSFRRLTAAAEKETRCRNGRRRHRVPVPDLLRYLIGFYTRILAISTLDTSDAALEAGADAFLQKPLDPLQLVSAVKDLLGASAFLRRSPGGPG